MDLEGEYREIVPDETHRHDLRVDQQSENFGGYGATLVTVEFEEEGEDATLVRLRHEGFPVDEESRKAHEEGWCGTFDKLEKLY